MKLPKIPAQYVPQHIPSDPYYGESAPVWIEPESVRRLTDLAFGQTISLFAIPDHINDGGR